MAIEAALSTIEVSYRSGTQRVQGSAVSVEVFLGLEGGDPLRGRRSPQIALFGHDYNPSVAIPIGFGSEPPPLMEP